MTAWSRLLALLLIPSTVLAMSPPAVSQSESAYRQGKAAPNDRAARREYQRGIDSARSVLASSPDEPSALLWLSA
ncbi:MAG TPA: hypothetical protein VH328_15160, partial [Burkholderiaceae bacterium]|nr:hypothetical protein [Burkholderiaceae bacterium]